MAMIDRPDPDPQTSAEDRDSDRLATELFRRYGSVERGLFRTRDHWVADATAVRTILATDATMARIVDELAQAPVRINTGDGEAGARLWSEGFDEGWRQGGEQPSTLPLCPLVVGLVAGAIAAPFVALVARRGRS